jgi:hypothetical protein
VVRAVATIQMTLSANRDYTHHCTPPLHWAPNGDQLVSRLGAELGGYPTLAASGWYPLAVDAPPPAGWPRPRLPAPPARGCQPHRPDLTQARSRRVAEADHRCFHRRHPLTSVLHLPAPALAQAVSSRVLRRRRSRANGATLAQLAIAGGWPAAPTASRWPGIAMTSARWPCGQRTQPSRRTLMPDRDTRRARRHPVCRRWGRWGGRGHRPASDRGGGGEGDRLRQRGQPRLPAGDRGGQPDRAGCRAVSEGHRAGLWLRRSRSQRCAAARQVTTGWSRRTNARSRCRDPGEDGCRLRR